MLKRVAITQAFGGYCELARRLRAAIEALPFEHPKLAVTAVVDGEALGDALERAIKRSGKLIETQAIKAVTL
jgi:hypothetical protein